MSKAFINWLWLSCRFQIIEQTWLQKCTLYPLLNTSSLSFSLSCHFFICLKNEVGYTEVNEKTKYTVVPADHSPECRVKNPSLYWCMFPALGQGSKNSVLKPNPKASKRKRRKGGRMWNGGILCVGISKMWKTWLQNDSKVTSETFNANSTLQQYSFFRGLGLRDRIRLKGQRGKVICKGEGRMGGRRVQTTSMTFSRSTTFPFLSCLFLFVYSFQWHFALSKRGKVFR